MDIRIARSAFHDLEDIIDYYNSQGAPAVGRDFSSAILEHIEVLARHPDIGRVVPEFALTHIREIIHAPFRVVYQRETDAITVIRIWRSERLLVLPAES